MKRGEVLALITIVVILASCGMGVYLYRPPAALGDDDWLARNAQALEDRSGVLPQVGNGYDLGKLRHGPLLEVPLNVPFTYFSATSRIA